MENFYTAYIKEINGVNFHFVKHYQVFPEYKNIPPLLLNYGMHTNFYKACNIANIEDENIRQQLFDSLPKTIAEAKIIQINRKADIYNLKNWTIKIPALLRLVNTR